MHLSPLSNIAWVAPTLPLRSASPAALSVRCIPLIRNQCIPRKKVSTMIHLPNNEQALPNTTIPVQGDTFHDHRTNPLAPYETFEEHPNPLLVSFSRPIPYYLHDQVYCTVGPGIFEATHSDGVQWKAEHPYDGISMISSFRFNADSNSVTCRSRVNSISLLEKIKSTPSYWYRNYKMDIRQESLLHCILNWRPPSMDSTIGLPYANYVVLLEKIPGKGLCARTDSSCAQAIDPISLTPVRQFRFSELHPKLGGMSSMAHGMHDGSSGEYFNVVWGMKPGKTDYNVFCTKKSGNTYILATFREESYYMHSASITKNFLIVLLQPIRMQVGKLLLSARVGYSLHVEDSQPVKFIVISRKQGGVVRSFTHSNFSSLHTVNAFESGDKIVIDLCFSVSIKQLMYFSKSQLSQRKAPSNSSIVRIELPNIRKEVSTNIPAKSQMIAKHAGDFPVISPDNELSQHRFVYTTVNTDGISAAVVQKTDLKTGATKRFGLQNCMFSELSFVPNPSGNAEDDGSLITVALNSATRKSTVIVLDARTFHEVSRAELPIGMPLGIHTGIHSIESLSS